jgi:quercetin dioxygenase-like cupin family protein
LKRFNLANMVNGWFVGDFTPCAHATTAAEVGVKTYKAGDVADAHVHRIATEVTLILTGEAEMNGQHLMAGDIATISPGESASFKAITDVVTVVVKTPSAPNDKYLS